MVPEAGLVLRERGEELVLLFVELGFAGHPHADAFALVVDEVLVEFGGFPPVQAAWGDAEVAG